MRIFTVFLFVLSCQSTFAQLKNPDFEIKRDSANHLPAHWNVVPVNGYTSGLDDQIKKEGKYSFKVVGKSKTSQFQNVSQTVAIKVKEAKRINITFYAKTDSLQGAAAVWCQLWDVHDKYVGFEHTIGQQQTITGTTDWKKYTLTLVVNPSITKLYFGGYSLGLGTTWFDHFTLEDVEATAPATAAVEKFSREFNAIVKKHSIYTDSLNWKQIDADLKSLGRGLKTAEEGKFLNHYVLNQLRKAGDNHSFVQDKVQAQKYASSNTNQDSVVAKLLPEQIGYIAVPGFGSTSPEVGKEFAQKIQDHIRKLDTGNQLKGWVVDLRGNTGGNMWPMIGGLEPLIGKGILGYFVKGKEKTPWHSYVKVKDAYTVKNEQLKIAVLIGPRTGSSGEMTAITFMGKPNTKFFGEPSAGYITANNMYPLSDGSKLLLASSYSADRNGKKYMDRLYPDVTIKSTKESSLALDAATAWLLGK